MVQGMIEDVQDLECCEEKSHIVLPPSEVGTTKMIQPHKLLVHDLDSLSFHGE